MPAAVALTASFVAAVGVSSPAAAYPPEPPDLVEALGVGGRQVITIELLNPFELAGRSSWFARPLSAVTPDLLRNVVYQRAVTMFRERSSEYGVEADVRLHRAE